MPIECPTLEEISDYLLGHESIDEDSIVEHLDDCPKCQRIASAVEDAQSDSDSLIRHLREPNEESMPDRVDGEMQELLDRFRTSLPTLPASAKDHVVEDGSLTGLKSELKQVREYRLLHKIAAGGMGTVYKARHERLNRFVAFKVLSPRRIRSRTAIERFQREMTAVGQLDHPNIVRVMDAGEENGVQFLVMEFVDGFDLSRLGRRVETVSIADACEMIRQAAQGLHHAHENNLVHRDVKSSNLLVAADGVVKVADLGLVRLDSGPVDDFTPETYAIGTLDYIAPEQADGGGEIDRRADIYSLGCSLYQLLTGAAPFATSSYETPMQKLVAHQNAEFPAIQSARPDVTDDLQAIVNRMMAKSPDDRFEDMNEVVQALLPHCVDHNIKALVEQARQVDASLVEVTVVDSNDVDSALIEDAEPIANARGIQTRTFDSDSIRQAPKTESTPPDRYWWLGPLAAVAVLGVTVAILAGLFVIIIRDSDGNKLAEVELPKGTSIKSEENRTTAILPNGRKVIIEENKPDQDKTTPKPSAVNQNEKQTVADANESVERLKYALKKNQVFMYRVKIETDRGDKIETYSGSPSYTVRSVIGDRIELRLNGILMKSRRYKRGVFPVGVPFDHHDMSPHSPFGGTNPFNMMHGNWVTIDGHGKIISAGGSSQLPMILGNLSELIIEPLGQPNQKNWTVESSITISLYESNSMFPRIPRGFGSGLGGRSSPSEQLAATQKSTYSIRETNDDTATIEKNYHLRTAVVGDQKPRIEIVGTGKLTFDLKIGMPRAYEFTATYTSRNGNVSTEFPISLSYQLLSEKERLEYVAKAKQAAEKAKAAAAARKKNPDYSGPSPVPSTNKKVTRATKLKVGNILQAKSTGQWFPVEVLEVFDDGRVKIHFRGRSKNWDKVVSRDNLQLPHDSITKTNDENTGKK